MRLTVVSTDPPAENEPEMNRPIDDSAHVTDQNCSSIDLPVMPAPDVNKLSSSLVVKHHTCGYRFVVRTQVNRNQGR